VILVMKADIRPDSPEIRQVREMAERYPDVRTEVRVIEGASRSLT
jgi:hypothetical protein